MACKTGLEKVISEGKAQLKIPASVFYNPVQEFNRDLSVLVLRTYLKYNVWHHRSEEKHVTGRGGMKVLDALSASGLRSIRYAKELGEHGKIVKSFVANDISEGAVDLIKKNIELNNVSEKVTSSLSDANSILHDSSRSFDDRFHVIDLDPFGTGARFFDAAVRGIGEAGLLMVTCTDTAVLCGNASESCFARYGSMSLRGEFCHEMALRILLRSLESHASVYGRYIKPLLSISADFYVRLFLQVFTQPSETKKSASKSGLVYSCKTCKTTETNPLGTYHLKDDAQQAKSKNDTVKFRYKPAEVKLGDKCQICGGSYLLGGPIWISPMHDDAFINLLKKELELSETKEDFATFKRIQGIIYMCSEELKVPLFHSISDISSTLQIPMPKPKKVLSALANAGYKTSSTHTNKAGFKTDAPSQVVWNIFCQLAEDQSSYTIKDQVARRIIEGPNRDKTVIYDFSYNPAIEEESKQLSLVRFQVNPTSCWGPKTRPTGKNSANDTERVSDTGQHEDSESRGGGEQKVEPTNDSPAAKRIKT